MRSGALVFALLLCSFQARAQAVQPARSVSGGSGKSTPASLVLPSDKTQPVRIPRFETAPVIDGKLDDDAWKTAAVLGDFYWTPNPGTAFYVGYNDDLNYNGFSPFTSHLEPGFRRNGRTFFIKTSYLFRRSI